LKIAAKLILSRLPFGYTIWQRIGLFRLGEMDTTEYSLRIFRTHAARIPATTPLCEATLLELGPGDSIATAIIAAAHGARAILVDSGRFARRDVRPYLDLRQALVAAGLRPPDLTACRSIDEMLGMCRATYLTDGLNSLRQIEAASVDLIFSQAVLEHVRRRQFLETMKECRRILKTGGVASHQVDLRDHLGGALNHLRFGAHVWESNFFANSGFYTNRISFGEMSRAFQRAGFSIELMGVRRWSSLPTPRSSLAPEFKDIPDEELCISDFDVVLR
jgi:SAM-dependent methyltransferase